MPYHGLEHERRQPEEVIRFAQYIARPPRFVFSESVARDDAHLFDDLSVSPVRTVSLNPYWRGEVVEAGLGHLIDDGNMLATAAAMDELVQRVHRSYEDASADLRAFLRAHRKKRIRQVAHMYWPVVVFGLVVVAMIAIAVAAGVAWWVNR